jgi:flagellar basal-body rod protein FlgB
MLAIYEKALDTLTLQHDLLTSNLAHVNTPRYHRRNLDFYGTMREVYARGAADAAAEVTAEPFSAERVDENNFDLERDVAALVENQILYQTTAQLASRRLAMMKSVLREGK